MTSAAVVRTRHVQPARMLHLLVGVAAAAVALGLDGLSWQFWLFVLAPEVPLLAGGGGGLQRGQLHPRAVPFYNATHGLAGPLAVTAVGGGTSLATGQTGVLVAGTAWLAHVCLDRACGFGLRDRSGFVRS